MTRGKLMDRIKVELAGGIAVRVVVGEETNFSLPGKGHFDFFERGLLTR